MSVTALVQPAKFSAAYSALPLRLSSFGATNSTEYKYLINILWDKVDKSSVSSAGYNQYIYTAITFTENHNFSKGDIVFVNDDVNGDEKTGYYTVMNVPSSNQIIIDLVPDTPWGASASVVSRVIKYKMSPDLESEAKLDLSNTIKDFVTQNLQDVNEIYEAPDTRFSYDLALGSESKFIYTFEDNYFGGASGVGFNNTLLTPGDVPFEIGDEVLVQQDLVGWVYTDNIFLDGNLGFTSSNTHNFRVGQQITIEGQSTQPYYNGPTTIIEVGPTWIKTDKTFTTSTPVEGGVGWGVPRPEYNGVFTITDIFVDGSFGLVITVNTPFTDSSGPIPGTIRFADDRLTITPNELVLTDKEAYNSRIHRLDYSINAYDKFVNQVRTSSANNISTILGSSNRYVIEASTKSWLLVHAYDTLERQFLPRFTFYDSSDNILSTYTMGLNYDYEPIVNIDNYLNNGGNLQLDTNTAHNLQPGDTVELFQSPYNGVYEVLSVQSSVLVTLDTGFLGGGLLGAEYLRKINNPYIEDYYFPVGLDQFAANTNTSKLFGATFSTIVDQIDYYEVYLERLGSRASNSVFYSLNDDCSQYDIYHLMWKDEKGSWISYPFIYISKDFTEVERKQYYKTEGNWSNNSFGYDSYGRGEKTYFARSRDKVLLNSGWIKEYENELIKDLMQSAAVYVQLPDGTLVGGVIEENQVELKKAVSDKIWNYTFNVRLTNNEYRF